MTKILLNTPCVGICSTVYGDDICRGCKRHAREIIDWNRYSETQQQIIFERLNQQITQLMQIRLKVIDSGCLKQQMDRLNIRYRPQQSPYTWAYYLLRAGAEKIIDLEKYGLQLAPAYQGLSLCQLFNEVDDEFYQLAITQWQD